MPRVNSAARYQIQVGAFKIAQNAEEASLRLKRANFNPVYEKYLDFTRVMITGVAAGEIASCLEKIKTLGFKEVIIRVDRLKPAAEKQAAPERSSPPQTAARPAPERSNPPEAPVRPAPEKPAAPEQREPAAPERSNPPQTAARPAPEAAVPEDTEKHTITDISEKWEIVTPGSGYTSFEFNQDNYYIVIENQDSIFGEPEQIIHFGEYTMPANDTIELIDLGEIKITANTDTGVAFSFTPLDKPDGTAALRAEKAESMPDTPQLQLFCRTWKIAGSSNDITVDEIIVFSKAGTYLETEPGGFSWLSEWRWYDEKNEEFEYSHDNWQHYGRAKILTLEAESLFFNDPGYFNAVEGYSSAGYTDVYELSPMRK
ncbi:MAG: hypothetical protein LBS37_01865 [Treponema sp.]|nr:hypothetical protein [Treponema sp.]